MEGREGPEIGTGLVAKGTGWAPVDKVSVLDAATTGTAVVPGAVVVNAGATTGAVMAG